MFVEPQTTSCSQNHHRLSHEISDSSTKKGSYGVTAPNFSGRGQRDEQSVYILISMPYIDIVRA